MLTEYRGGIWRLGDIGLRPSIHRREEGSFTRGSGDDRAWLTGCCCFVDDKEWLKQGRVRGVHAVLFS